MFSFLRFLLGVLLLPACWGVTASIIRVLSTCGISTCSLSFLAGVVAFALCWMLLSHPVKTYVLGHELTHAMWGLMFGAVPSRLRVGPRGGSVDLTKSNLLITLAPYFFPFYTFIVIVIAVVVRCFVNPLPWLPFWIFLIGFTWAFHVLFTLDSLSQTQPDVTLYGRIFSWTFIFISNVLLVLFGIAFATGWRLGALCRLLGQSLANAYLWCWQGGVRLVDYLIHLS